MAPCCNLVRGCLVWLGRGDPAATQINVGENDPVREARAGLLRAWYEALGERDITLSEVFELHRDHPHTYENLMAALAGLTNHKPPFTPKSVAWPLRKALNQITGGLMLEDRGTGDHGRRYRVLRVGVARQAEIDWSEHNGNGGGAA